MRWNDDRESGAKRGPSSAELWQLNLGSEHGRAWGEMVVG